LILKHNIILELLVQNNIPTFFKQVEILTSCFEQSDQIAFNTQMLKKLEKALYYKHRLVFYKFIVVVNTF